SRCHGLCWYEKNGVFATPEEWMVTVRPIRSTVRRRVMPRGESVPRIVDLTLPVVSGMAGIPKIPFYEQYPVKVQAVTVVNEEQRASLAREGVDVMSDAPAINSMNTVLTLNTHVGT